MSEQIPKFAFFGSPDFAVDILDKLEEHELLPELIITAPDRKKGRGQEKSPPPVGVWAKDRGIPTLQPEEIDTAFIQKLRTRAPKGGWDLFVVVAYGHILPEELIYLPTHHTLNMHPSLLPRLRGAAPIRGAILQEDETGVSIIELDTKMDHGPIVAQKKVATDRWPPAYNQLKKRLATAGGELLAQTIPKWIQEDITASPQDEENASYIKKFTAEDGEIDLSDSPEKNIRKIRAFTDWPKAHFFVNDKRILITAAHIESEKLVIDRVKPAGREEMPYEEFIKKTDQELPLEN